MVSLNNIKSAEFTNFSITNNQIGKSAIKLSKVDNFDL
jgi:hypothetical protein